MMLFIELVITVLFFPAVRLGKTLGESRAIPQDGKTALLTLLLVILIPVIVVFLFIIKSVYSHTIGKQLKTTLREDYENEAQAYIRKEKFVSAGNIYETKLKDFSKAAEYYKKGGDYKRAAHMYDYLDMSRQSKEMYQKAGDFDDAASISLLEGEYEEAAQLYDRAGKKADAAAILERSGRRLAAVRAYREAGKYRKAAYLLEQEGKYREAAEMFGYLLAKQKPGRENIKDFYTYALLSDKADQTEKAEKLFMAIDHISPGYEDVRERLRSYSPKEEVIPDGFSTLRSFMKSGNISPHHSLKLWVHILKELKTAYGSGRPFGRISPDTIGINMQNTIVFLNRNISPEYRSPENKAGDMLDERSDIYSAGILLYELLAGDLNGLGVDRLIDMMEDIPDWLDDMVMKCVRKVREDRYQSIDDIFRDLKALSSDSKD